MISIVPFMLIVAFSLVDIVVPFVFSMFPSKYKEKKSYEPSITVIVPSRNEETIMEDVLSSWEKIDYPKSKTQILCIDNSTDSTIKIIKGFEKKDKRFTYIQGKTKSKLGAVLLGVKKSKNEVILISDSDVVVNPDCVKECVHLLTNKEIGAVFGKRTPINYNKTLFSRWDAFRLLKTFIAHKFFTNVDSSIYFSASPCAIRKEDLLDIKQNDELIADDLYVALHLRKKGLKVVFNPNVEGKVGVLNNLSEVFVRNPRSSKGTAQIALNGYDGTLFNKELGNFGNFVIPYKLFFYLGMTILYPLLFISLIGDAIFSAFNGSLMIFHDYLATIAVTWYGISLLGAFLFALIVMTRLKHKDYSFFLIMFIDPILSFINMFAGFIGFYSQIFGRKVEWKKTQTDRIIK